MREVNIKESRLRKLETLENFGVLTPKERLELNTIRFKNFRNQLHNGELWRLK